MHQLVASGPLLQDCENLRVCVRRSVCVCVCVRRCYQIHILVGQINFHNRAVITSLAHLVLALLWIDLRPPRREVTGKVPCQRANQRDTRAIWQLTAKMVTIPILCARGSMAWTNQMKGWRLMRCSSSSVEGPNICILHKHVNLKLINCLCLLGQGGLMAVNDYEEDEEDEKGHRYRQDIHLDISSRKQNTCSVILTLCGSRITHISTLKSSTSILPTSNRRRFQSILIFHGFHNQPQSHRSSCPMLLWKKNAEDQEENTTDYKKWLLIKRLAWRLL